MNLPTSSKAQTQRVYPSQTRGSRATIKRIRINSIALLPLELESSMPLFEIETDAHIIITWADDEAKAREVAADSYPGENILRLSKRPRNSWVISKGVLGIKIKTDPCSVARDCLSKAAGDKVHAIRLYMQQTGDDLEQSRKVIETNMVMGW
jgi:hypothetical protein